MNTINLLSAISVLACNVSMANIPKQVNNSDYGNIAVITKDVTYNQSNSLTSSYGIADNSKDYNVYREIGSYSDDRINFYTERYYFDAAWNSDGQVIAFGYTTFFTVAIYDNTLLTDFTIKHNVGYSSYISISGSKHRIVYNEPFDITNLGNTLYFSNYNLKWNDGDLFPLVATCSDSYLSKNTYNANVDSAIINDVLSWETFSNNFDNQHGSINACATEVFVVDTDKSDLNIGQLVSRTSGLSFTYKYYINNPTYEVIDLPNVMLSILTMPFTFFSQAFNLTLFPNTPYALNIGHTILIIVGVIGTIYLIRYLVSIFKG